jgi:uncharacterized protein
MKIDNEFTVSVPIDAAWAVLTDLEGIAPCLPGAQLTGVQGDVYTGKIKIKVGPVVSNYAGTAQFVEKDDANHRAVIDAKGKDSRGSSNASAAIHAALRAAGDRTVVSVHTDLNITGKIAQFGGGAIKEVSAKLLGQFVDNLETKLLAPAASAVAQEEGSSDDTAHATLPPATGAAAPGGDPGMGAGTAGGPGVEARLGGTAGSDFRAADGLDTATADDLGATGTGPATGTGAAADSAPHAESNGHRPEVRTIQHESEPEPLDLLSLAGGATTKKALTAAAALAALAALVVWLVRR